MDKNQMRKRLARVYRHIIEILQPVATSDGLNQRISFEPLIKCHADVKNLYGAEYFQAKAVGSEEMIKFIVRKIPGVTISTAMAIRYKGKDYNIKQIDDMGNEGRSLEIKAAIKNEAQKPSPKQPAPSASVSARSRLRENLRSTVRSRDE